MVAEKRFATYEDLVLDKLKLAGKPLTTQQWAKLSGYKNPNSFYVVVKKLKSLGKIEKIDSKQPYRYKLKETTQ